MSDLFEVVPGGIATVIAGYTSVSAGAVYLGSIISNRATRYSAQEWAALWKEKRDWLALASQGLQEQDAAASLREISSILQVAGKPLRGHQTFRRRSFFKVKDSPYTNMYLTLGLFEEEDKVWRLTSSEKPAKGKPNRSQEVIVNGLEELARMVGEVPEEMDEWHKKVSQLVCEQASHYFLAYSASPTVMTEKIGGVGTLRPMQIHLNNSVVRLLTEAKEILESGDEEAEVSPQARINKARELVESLELTPNPDRLSLGALTDEEFSLIQALRADRRQLMLDASKGIANATEASQELEKEPA